jgi:hypothetical protein
MPLLCKPRLGFELRQPRRISGQGKRADQRQIRDRAGAAELPRGVSEAPLPIDGFFEWKAIKGQKAKQPYAIAMKDGSPFGIAGIWENEKESRSSE